MDTRSVYFSTLFRFDPAQPQTKTAAPGMSSFPDECQNWSLEKTEEDMRRRLSSDTFLTFKNVFSILQFENK
jgi:hypothetical protein